MAGDHLIRNAGGHLVRKANGHLSLGGDCGVPICSACGNCCFSNAGTVTAAITSALVAANWDCIVANLPAYYNADITEIPMADARSRVSSLFQTALALLAIGPVTLPNTAAASWGAGTTAANLPTCLLIDNGVPSDAYTEKTSAGVTKICETADGWRITVAAGEDFPATPSLYDSAFQVVIEITLSGGTCCGGTGLPTVEVHFYLKHMLWLTPAVAAAFLGPGHDPVFPDGCSAGAWCTWQLDSWLIDDASLSGCALPDPALTADIAVNNNKCCRCSGGDCVNSSDASNAVCDGGGVNTCVDGQDADCGPFP